MTNAEIKRRLSKLLDTSVLKIVFTKKDGSERTMLCTKNFPMIEEKTKQPVDLKGKNLINPDVCRVFDMEIDDWRSFRIDSVKSIEKIA